VSDRTTSANAKSQQDRERVAVVLAVERLPWHPAIQERFGIERSGWRALVESVFPSAKTVEGVLLALSYCKARKLDVFKRPVHIVPIWNSDLRREVETVWPGVGELLTTAMRTGEFAGFDECQFGPDITQSFTGTVGRRGEEKEVTVELTFPLWGQLTCYRFMGKNSDKVVVAGPRVYWLETYATIGRSSVPNAMWQKRPRGQLEKCCLAASLRRGFPEEVGSDATAEEVGGDSTGITIDHDPLDHIAMAAETVAPKAETRQRRGEPKETPRQDAKDEATAGSETERGKTASNEPPASQQAPDKAADAAPETKTDPSDGFSAWLVDANGAETTEEPIPSAIQFAHDLVALCASNPEDIDLIMEQNEPAILEAKEANVTAKKIIEAIKANEAADSGEGPNEPEITLVQVPKTTKGGEHWPNYAEACRLSLAECEDLAAVNRWEAVNIPTYRGRAIEGKITTHLRNRRVELGSPAPAPQEPEGPSFSERLTQLAGATLNELQRMEANATYRSWLKDLLPPDRQEWDAALATRFQALRSAG
jgi:phage recombination protein Bet